MFDCSYISRFEFWFFHTTLLCRQASFGSNWESKYNVTFAFMAIDPTPISYVVNKDSLYTIEVIRLCCSSNEIDDVLLIGFINDSWECSAKGWTPIFSEWIVRLQLASRAIIRKGHNQRVAIVCFIVEWWHGSEEENVVYKKEFKNQASGKVRTEI